MMVPVNQNIDEYKDDFFKGLTMRQTMYAIAAVVVSGGLMTFFLLYLKMNASVAMYITLPIVFPIIAVGFIKIHGMNFRDYMKEKRKVRQKPVFFYEPELVHQLNNGKLISKSDDILPDIDGKRDSSEARTDPLNPVAQAQRAPSAGTIRQGKPAKIYLQTEESIEEVEDIMSAPTKNPSGDIACKSAVSDGQEETENVIANDEFCNEKGGDPVEANERL